MFQCMECKYESDTFQATVVDRDRGALVFKAKCPACGSQLVKVTGTEPQTAFLYTEETSAKVGARI